MDVSIIIVNYHSTNMVIDCIHSILEKTADISFEIIVVDNASGDGCEVKIEHEFGEKVQVVLSDTNLGFGKANNLGAIHAKGKYLFLLNPDTYLVNNAIQILFEYLENHEKVGVAGGNLFAPDLSETPSYCLVFDSPESEKRRASWTELISSKMKAKLYRRIGKPDDALCCDEFNHTEKALKVAYIFGADMMLPKNVFEEVGGFDPDFFMYAEEEEMSWRITKAGYQIMNIPQAKIIHLEGATVKSMDVFSEKQFRMRMNGTFIYYLKCFGIEGVNKFYKYRSLRYERLIKIAKIQGKLTTDFPPILQKQILKDVYQEFLDNYYKEFDYGRSM